MVEVIGDGRGKWRTLRPRFIGHAHKLGDIVRGPTGNASDGSDLTTGRETLAESFGSSKIRAVRLDVNLGFGALRLSASSRLARRRPARGILPGGACSVQQEIRPWSADSADANGYDRTAQVRRLIRRGSGGAAVNAVTTAEPVALERVGVIARRPTCR